MSLFYIKTFGCQMNKGDSELIIDSMTNAGFEQTNDPISADILIYNTCSVRQHAEDRALAHVRGDKSKNNSKPLTVITGCMAQRTGNDLIKKHIADIVIGPYETPATGAIISDYLREKTSALHLSQEAPELISRIDPHIAEKQDLLPWHKWVTITHGCDNYCSYCIVPHVRGKMISFPSGSIIDYIRRCIDNGVREVSLLGQNVNQYGMDNGDLPFHKLLEKTAQIKGLERINFITSHPKDFTIDIIKVIRDYGHISRSIHLPIQSGSDRILGLMNRKYDYGHYIQLVEQIELHLKTYSLTTDILVGFPGETEDDFNLTLEAVSDIRFDGAFMYAYSRRDGTKAAQYTEDLNRQEKLERLQRLISLQRKISMDKLRSRINQREEIIIEGRSKKSPNEVIGRTLFNHPVIIPGEIRDVGRKIQVIIKGIRGSTLYGERIA